MAISAARTLELITKYGKDATFRTYPNHTYTASTGTVTLGTATDYSYKVVEGVASEQFKHVDGVKGSDWILFASPSGMSITPVAGMIVVYESTTCKITAVRSWEYKGSVVLYEMAVKRPG